MIAKITAFIQSLQQHDVKGIEQSLSIELACTVLLCEVVRADGELQKSEKVHLAQIVESRFNIDATHANELISQAAELCEHATDFHQFTSIINQHYDSQEKVKIVSLLWQLALADGHVAAIEEHTIRRIADLLHLRHSEYICAKTSVIAKP